jgi:hypothetical protein
LYQCHCDNLAILSAVQAEPAAPSFDVLKRSYGLDCPHCGDGEAGTDCDLRGYSVRRVRFIRVPLHLEEYRAAYINPGSAASRNILRRLENEYRTLPPRHSCSCWPGHCAECRHLDDQRPKGPDVAVEIGRGAPVRIGTVPNPAMLDLERAVDVLGDTDDTSAIARYMSRDGTSLSPTAPSPVERMGVPYPTVLELYHGLLLLLVAALVLLAWRLSTRLAAIRRARWTAPAVIGVLVLGVVAWNVPRVVPLPGVSAMCRDETYSYSAHRSGTCSGHRGVARWINSPAR